MLLNGQLEEIGALTDEAPDAERKFLEFARLCADSDICFSSDGEVERARELLQTKPNELGICGNPLIEAAIKSLAVLRPVGW